MTNEAPNPLQSIDEVTLTPLVRRALDSDTAQITHWDSQQIHMSTQLTVKLRFSGEAKDGGEVVPWSLVLKAIPPRDDRTEPSEPQYWKREVLAYQSGLLEELPGGVAAPRCYDVTEQPGGSCWVWMEDIADRFPSVDDIGPDWPLAHYGVAARHLGQFNGAYIMGRPIPSQPWLSRRWLRATFVRPATAAGIDQLRDSLDDPTVRGVFTPHVAASIFDLWAQREIILQAVESLPSTLCHFDAYRRNLFARHGADGSDQTVVIDWAFVGPGALGEDIVPLVMASLLFREVEVASAPGLDHVVFDGYLEGLRDAGWRGDPRLARFGYAAASALRYGTSYTGHFASALLDPANRAGWAGRLGCSPEEIDRPMAGCLGFVHALADEARELLESL